ncbi:MAG: hypothetical protein ACJAYU_002633 [Bradymonadia bacterium]|jgi:hypothetical protein
MNRISRRGVFLLDGEGPELYANRHVRESQQSQEHQISELALTFLTGHS